MADTPTPTTPDSRKRKFNSYTVAYKLGAIQYFKNGEDDIPLATLLNR